MKICIENFGDWNDNTLSLIENLEEGECVETANSILVEINGPSQSITALIPRDELERAVKMLGVGTR